MKFNLENFLELDTTQLLAVNGGSGCGGSSGGAVLFEFADVNHDGRVDYAK